MSVEETIEYFKKNFNQGIECLPEKYRNKEFYLKLVSKHGIMLKYLPDEFKSDREIVETAVKQFGKALNYADKKFYSDRNIIETALVTDGMIILLASTELKEDFNLILKCVSSSGLVPLNYLDSKWADNDEIIEAGLRVSPQHLHMASNRILNERRDLVIKACKLNGRALENTTAFSNANKIPTKYHKDREIILVAIETYPDIFQYLPHFDSDREIIEKVLRLNFKMFIYCSDEIKKDREFSLEICKKNKVIWIAEEEFRDNFDFVWEYLDNITKEDKNTNFLAGVSERLLSNELIALKSLLYSNNSLTYLTNYVKELKIVKQFISRDIDERRNDIRQAIFTLKNPEELGE